LLDFMKEKLNDVKDVRLSQRLKESAACLVVEEGEMGAHLERLMQRLNRGQDVPVSKRVLEVNASHPAVAAIQDLFTRDAHDPRIDAYCRLLYEQAVIAEGSKVRDPVAFAQRVNELLARDAAK
jgi:molecular chaperone HtpG